MKKTMKRLFALIFAIAIMTLSTTVIAANNEKVNYFEADSKSVLKGKSIVFLGDSICEARCEQGTEYDVIRGWAGRIGVHNQMTYQNLGRSGASVSNCRGNNTLITQVDTAYRTIQESDIYILHGGTNDAWDSAAVGTYDKKDFSGNYDVSTFAGGLEEVFYTIKKQYPNAIFGFIINFKFTNTGFGGMLMDMDEYVSATKGICDKWEIPYIDLYSNNELLIKLQPQTGAYLSDGVHPTTAGYDVITPYIEDWLKGLVSPKKPEEEVVSSNVSSIEEKPESLVESKTESAAQESSCVSQASSVVAADNESDDSNVLLIVAIAVVVLAVAVIAAVVVILVIRKKKK